ncbi:AAA family ATPase [Nostoc sp. FACHB-892]|uniref:AAA family ATPase n=1 Tax=Nostoc sp. FACHB-892 TaxID=2692843 RepID=UPI00168309DF|nr:ATP-binding protein [Nostoc sp. FACHB-892]MBD2724831.1 AAA family ATPase [Nostoc sp. FACHB-892]
MLKQLILENWKSFRYAELPLDPLTVLIGTNASGKSNVIEAFEFLQRIARGENIEAALAGDKTLPSIRGGVDWAALKPETEFILKFIVQGEDENTDYLYAIKIQTQPVVITVKEFIQIIDVQSGNSNILSDFSIRDKDSFFPIRSALNSMPGRGRATGKGIDEIRKRYHLVSDNDISDKIRQINYLVTSSLEKVFVLNPIPSTMRSYSLISDTLESDASNIAGVLAGLLPDEQKNKVESTLSYYLKYLPEGDIQKIWAEKVGRFGTDAMLYCQEEWKPGHITEIDARSMSDGTLRFIAILTALLTRPEGSQIVIEEIDNGLHPSRAELLVRILREIGQKRKIDILLTTHNPTLLDALGPEIVPFVVVAHRDKETGESKLTLLEDVDNFSKLFASYSLGDMTTKGAIERSLSRNE